MNLAQFQLLLKGLLLSISIFLLTLAIAFPGGLVVALCRKSRFCVLRMLTQGFVAIMRGTPLMLQLLVVYFGPYYLFGWSLASYPSFLAVIIAFGLNYSAYFSEIYRAGIEAIPIGQYEAAEVLGYSKAQTFFKIILPQVVKRILPPITNEVITLVKDTSLAQVLAVQEMFTIAKQISNARASMLALIYAGVFYFIFNFIVAAIMARMEAKLSYYR
jgi:polar amino acid transport system permease protein